jgi:hypothetical protein
MNQVKIITGARDSGYGHEFEESFLTFDLQGSSGHHRIIRYNLGGIESLGRFEVDGYIDDRFGDHQTFAEYTYVSLRSHLSCANNTADRRSRLNHTACIILPQLLKPRQMKALANVLSGLLIQDPATNAVSSFISKVKVIERAMSLPATQPSN